MDGGTFPQLKRRVNPDSLASRLEPELVREMNALIIPGKIEMPSFAVRKELQERYNIDRRHIYDYFHSKGLRVVKDDKVNNLVRRTERPTKVPQITLRPLRQAQPRKYNSLDDRHDISFLRRKCDKLYTADRVKKPAKRYSRTIVKNRTQVPSAPFIEPPSSPQPLQFYHLDDEDLASSLNLPAKPVNAFTRGPTDTSYNNHQRINNGPCIIDILREDESTIDSLTDCSSDNRETSFILSLEGPLPKEERMAFYNAFDAILGPACGIQESVGTYRKYMEDQSRLYYQRLYRNFPGMLGNTSRETSLSTDVPPTGLGDKADFRKWLPHGQTLRASDHSYPKSRLCSTNVRLSSLPCTAHMCSEVENGILSSRFNVGENSSRYPPCFDETDDAALNDLVPEQTPIDVLRHLLDPFDPVERSTVPCSGQAMADRDKSISPTDSKVRSCTNDDDCSNALPPALEGMCSPFFESPILNNHSRTRSVRMCLSADIVVPMDAEAEMREDHFHQLSSSVLASITHTAAIRNFRLARKRSSSTVSTRLRTTSAGGGM